MSTRKEPLVSILIPFYNHNHFITKTLDSVIEDTYTNKEILIINDGSSNLDDSSIDNWMNKHLDVNIRYIKRENKGVTKTLNELIYLSSGKYIIVCASDDYLINNTISRRVEILEKNDTKLLLISDNIVVDDNNNKLYDSNIFEYRKGNIKNYEDDEKLKKTIITKWALAGACYIVDRRIFDEVGFYNEDLIVEDWDFFLRVVANNFAQFYNEKVSAYRLHDTNTINNPKVSIKMYENQTFVAKKNMKLFPFPLKIFMMKRYYKYWLKLRKLNREFPYNSIFWKDYKKFKKNGLNTSKAIKQIVFKNIVLNKINKKNFDINNVKTILIARYDKIGDMVFTLPLIEIIKKKYPNINIDIYCSESNYLLIKENQNIYNIYIDKKKNRIESFLILLKLRQNNYDLVLDMFENRLSNTLIRMKIISGKYLCGMDKYRKHGFMNEDLEGFYLKIFGKDKTKHIIYKNLEFLDIFDINDKKYNVSIDIPNEFMNFHKNLINKNKINVLFNSEGSSQSRILNIQQIEKILNIINTENCNIILVAMEEQFNILRSSLGDNINIYKVTSIFETISLIKYSDIILSVDTSIVHFASIFDKKIVGIYSGDEENYMANHPFSDDYKVVRATSKGNSITQFDERKVSQYVNEYVQEL